MTQNMHNAMQCGSYASRRLWRTGSLAPPFAEHANLAEAYPSAPAANLMHVDALAIVCRSPCHACTCTQFDGVKFIEPTETGWSSSHHIFTAGGTEDVAVVAEQSKSLSMSGWKGGCQTDINRQWLT